MTRIENQRCNVKSSARNTGLGQPGIGVSQATVANIPDVAMVLTTPAARYIPLAE